MKGGTAHWIAWGQYVAVGAAYEAVYAITYHLSSPQFLLTTGLRLACMLLLPRRFWLAIAVGESIPLIENAVFCASKFGMTWAVLASVPTVALWWPLMNVVLQRWSLFENDGRLCMPVILISTLGVATITSVITTVTWIAALMHMPGKFPGHDPVQVVVSCLLGAYLGALTLTPVILAMRERFRALGEPLKVATVWRSPLLRDVLWWVVPTLAALAYFTQSTTDESLQQAIRLALLWPVLGLAWRYGWHGTAVGGMMASFALASTAHGLLDPETLKVQMALALVLSGALIFGARQRGVSTAAQPNLR